MPPEVVALDADDTLWHSENGFHEITGRFADLLVVHAPAADAAGVIDLLDWTERANLVHFGYGVKSFTLSMIETAAALLPEGVPAPLVRDIVALGKELLARPVDLIDGVAEVVPELAGRYRLLLITKGDLLHQERKVAESGLAPHFEEIEVVSEKDEATYARILHEHGVRPEAFVMVGNSIKSDVLPVVGIGGRAVHIPYEYLWQHEHADHDGSVPELATIKDLPAWLAAQR
jgi:putative hydrolase of the HAD superfamily